MATAICPQCQKEFRNQGALNLHGKVHKPKTIWTEPTPMVESPSTIVFYSPRAHGLTVVVRPEYKQTKTIGGTNGPYEVQDMIPGVTVQFEMGRFVTSDPETIHYLEDIYPTIHANDRFPILSSRKMREMVSA